MIISAIGDSITQGVGNNDISWVDFLKDYIEITKINKYGIAATKVADDGSENPFVNRFLDIDKASDVIIVFGGVNDFNHNIPLGTINSHDPHKFYGALNIIADGLQDNFPFSEILFITPLKTYGFKNYPHWNIENEVGAKLIDYRNAIIEVCLNHSIPVLDLFAESGLTPDILNIKTNLLPDGLHPSKEGYKKLARKIAKKIKYSL